MVYEPDVTSCSKFTLVFLAVFGGIIWWLGPVLGIFVIDPMVQLLVGDTQVITPDTACSDHRKTNYQECDDDVFVDYYFWNITNPTEWAAGTEPPQYEQIGPCAFVAKEVRYNLAYNEDFTELGFSYHQYANFLPNASCPTCTLDAPITSVNRAYLQFLSAPVPAPLDPESSVIYSMMPITLSIVRDSINAFTTAAIAGAVPGIDQASLKAVASQATIQQWTDCGFLQPVVPVYSLSTPYLADFPLPPGTPGFPYAPELCAYIPIAIQQYLGLTVVPSDFPTYGLAINYTSAQTFMDLAIGQSNSTYLDPAAAYFLGKFLTVTREAVLAELGTFNPAAATSLGGITEQQWPLVQGYIASLVPTWGKLVYGGWLQAGGGGLIITRPLSDWLYGYDDPLLLTAAQGIAAQTGAPEAYKLMPWTYKPSWALTFATKDEPLEYFNNVTGLNYTFPMLSWNSSQIGQFHPLVQQKRLQTGKSKDGTPQGILQYRGLPFNVKSYGLVNVTGVNEGVSFGQAFEETQSPIAFDSAIGRPTQLQFTGYHADVKGLDTLVYNLTQSSIAACNWTEYGMWAATTGFDPAEFATVADDFAYGTPLYWQYMTNNTALEEYLNSTALGSFGRYFNGTDVGRDRCMQPDAFKGMWDMSSLLACPTIYTFPKFYDGDDFVVYSSGTNKTEWNATFEEHSYSINVEPFTGFAVQGHKTYQINHLVSRTTHLNPTLWVAPGTGAAVGLSNDFVTVPTMWVKMTWVPTDGIASIISTLLTAQDVLYYMLVVCFPVIGWLMLFPSLFLLKFGKAADVRHKALVDLQKTRARATRLTRHEKEMIEALLRLANGSSSVELPEPIPEGMSEIEEIERGISRASSNNNSSRTSYIRLTSSTMVPLSTSTPSSATNAVSHQHQNHHQPSIVIPIRPTSPAAAAASHMPSAPPLTQQQAPVVGILKTSSSPGTAAVPHLTRQDNLGGPRSPVARNLSTASGTSTGGGSSKSEGSDATSLIVNMDGSSGSSRPLTGTARPPSRLGGNNQV